MIVIAFAASAVMTTAVAVVLIVVVVSVQGEDRHGELPHDAPTLIARSVRRLIGLRVCQPGGVPLHPAPLMHKATGRADRALSAISPGQVTDLPPRTQTGTVSSSDPDAVASNRRPA